MFVQIPFLDLYVHSMYKQIENAKQPYVEVFLGVYWSNLQGVVVVTTS